MSGDLISRKALMEKAKDYFISPGGALRLIEGQPTAYDADKVVDEIEKIISSYESCVETSLKEIEREGEDKMSSEICSLHNNRGCLKGLRMALEIAKSGGVADD